VEQITVSRNHSRLSVLTKACLSPTNDIQIWILSCSITRCSYSITPVTYWIQICCKLPTENKI